MAIQHMPYGMLDGINCGFGRLPVLPLAGEIVRIFVRIDECVSHAVLTWTADGMAREPLQGDLAQHDGDDRIYAVFYMKTPDKPAAIRYCIHAGAEQTPLFEMNTLDRQERLLFPASDFISALQSNRIRIKRGSAACRSKENEEEVSDFISVVKRFTDAKIELIPTLSLFCDAHGRIRETELTLRVKGTHVYGLGERFNGVDQQNQTLTLRVEEQFGCQKNHSYLPVPMLYTECGVGIFIDNPAIVRVSAMQKGAYTVVTVRQEIRDENDLFPAYLLHGTPTEMIRLYQDATGKPALPPKWALGIWMSANGWNTQKEVMHQLEMCKKLDLPATVLVIEAWSDEKTFYLWNDAQYEMQGGGKRYGASDLSYPANGKWPDPLKLIQAYSEAGIRTVLWQIPVIKRAWEGSIPQLDADEAYAIEKGYCIFNRDGTPYRISDGWFAGSLLMDFTNEEACEWWFGKRQYLLDMGVAGFKTDGGEFLFNHDAMLHNGLTGAELHNLYPLQYVRAYHQFAGVTFSRAGYSGAQTMPIHWAGDQWSTWEALRAQVCAGISAGLSGIPFWSFDMAGFAGPLPGAELYLRSLAVAAFCPVMQWHSEPRDGQYAFTADSKALNDRSPWNISLQTGDERIIPAYRRLTKIRMRLMDYLYDQAQVCVSSARPLMAHLIVDFPDDPKVWSIQDAYMLGHSLMIAPVLDEGADERNVYLPKGEWLELFTGTRHAGEQTIRCVCKPGDVPVFARENHEELRAIFQEE